MSAVFQWLKSFDKERTKVFVRMSLEEHCWCKGEAARPLSTLSYIKQKTCGMAREFRDKLDARKR